MHIRILTLILLLSAGLAAGSPVFAQNQSAQEGIAAPIKAVLQVPLPFVPENPDLSQYIAGVYRLAIGLAAVFAVVMIIIAGYQWIFSGGSSDKTGAAKKRIFGAAVGLMLALLSYIILNAITPRLVELRLPTVSPVGTMLSNLSGNLCNSQEVKALITKKFGVEETADAATGLLAELTPDGQVKAGQNLVSFAEADQKTFCGTEYKIGELTGEYAVCGGVVCRSDSGDSLPESCISGTCQAVYLLGEINWPPFTNTYVDTITVHSVCNETNYLSFQGYLSEIDSRQVARSTAYRFSSEKFILADPYTNTRGRDKLLDAFTKNYCYNQGGLKGFVLEVEVNDASSLWPTLDDDFAVGKSSSGADKCAGSSLYTQAGDVRNYDFDDIDWSQVSQSQLFQPDDFANGAVCNLEINSGEFPAS